MTKEKKAKILVLILQSIGCKITFTENSFTLTRPELLTDTMYQQISDHKAEIQNVIDSDLRLMSINHNKGAVGSQLKSFVNKYYADIDCDSMQGSFDKLDARGHEWCKEHKHKIISMMQDFALKNNLKFTYRQMLTIVKKAISDARKSFIS
jgi:hypothetical protein